MRRKPCMRGWAEAGGGDDILKLYWKFGTAHWRRRTFHVDLGV